MNCRGLTRSGRPCKNRAADRAGFCRLHASGMPAPVQKSDRKKRLAADIKRVMGDLKTKLECGMRDAECEMGAGEAHAAREGSAGEASGADGANGHERLPGWLLAGVRQFLEAGGYSGRGLESLRNLWDQLAFTAASVFEEARRRFTGEYEVDEFGFDEAFCQRLRPLFSFLYRMWWRVEVTGSENIPARGRALLVGNRTGFVPYDGAMVAQAVHEETQESRYVRALHDPSLAALPFVSTWLQRCGMVSAEPESCRRLLDKDQLVAIFPEGVDGVDGDGRRTPALGRFGRATFVRVAIEESAPIVPVAVVGAREVHPVLARLDFLARPLGLPGLAITPTFPWLGPFGLIPLPTRWRIHFGAPVDVSGCRPEDGRNFAHVARVAGAVGEAIAALYIELVGKRSSLFW